MGIKIITKNKRASFDYQLQEVVEAGLVLVGTEVKSIREGKVKINDAYISIDQNQEAWIQNMHIAHYEFGNQFNHLETRKRKLLLTQAEIKKLSDRMKQDALTLIATKLYFKKSYVKIEIALAKGKKLHDKRESIKEKDMDRKLKQGQYD